MTDETSASLELALFQPPSPGLLLVVAVAVKMRKCQPLLAGGGSCTSFNNVVNLECLVGLVPVLLHMRGSEKNSIYRNIEVGILVGILYIAMVKKPRY